MLAGGDRIWTPTQTVAKDGSDPTHRFVTYRHALQLVAHHVGVPYRVPRAFEAFLGTPFVLVIQALKSFPKATLTSSTPASSATPTTIHPPFKMPTPCLTTPKIT